ncbi:phage tail assembly protein [Streptomyces caniscabiei]|uniref:Phage tail assembly protein n=1 Tax=Streptomyces caniscabiei TaxID=2746961 RepID=A0ABU4MJJ6_9ACTN|nr:phage tail assembly protein [Streptomyces caniscabiei]MBE4791023.1 phage tail assembly protein [Streptomyces caniscabiei]MDX3009652.1 phage tail assembly protein [Streptomyces caniscabiei]MDX3037297.1 phage tail assembly protein [Streptomyces caniscabiei]
MAEPISVEDLQRQADDKYPGLPLKLQDGTVVTLKNLLRLNDTAQKNATILIDAIKTDDDNSSTADQLEKQKRVVRDLLLLVCDNPTALKPVVDDWDLALLLLVMEKWQKETELPEADGSPS